MPLSKEASLDFTFFENLTTGLVSFVAVCTGATAVMIFGEKIFGWFKKAKGPHDEHVKQVQSHEEKLTNDFKLLQEIRAEQQNIKTGQQLNTRVLLQILNHIIEGNHVENLRESRDFINRYLVER